MGLTSLTLACLSTCLLVCLGHPVMQADLGTPPCFSMLQAGSVSSRKLLCLLQADLGILFSVGTYVCPYLISLTILCVLLCFLSATRSFQKHYTLINTCYYALNTRDLIKSCPGGIQTQETSNLIWN